jgi:hypothetical protein
VYLKKNILNYIENKIESTTLEDQAALKKEYLILENACIDKLNG